MILLACVLILLLAAAYRAYRAVADDLALASLDINDAPPTDPVCALCRSNVPLVVVRLFDGAAYVCLPCQSVLAHTRAVA